MDELKSMIHEMGRGARRASLALAVMPTEAKNAILRAMAETVIAEEASILSANARDLDGAEAKGLTKAMIDRLRLDAKGLQGIAQAVLEVADLPDPVGEVLTEWTRPNGLRIVKKRVPIGVIGIIYESRPNVTSDSASLCFKAGNSTILRGGSEAFHSNQALAKALQSGGQRAGLPKAAIQLIPNTDRASVKHMAEMDQYLDLIIPRGGKSLIETVVSLARMPVIKHYDGICHVYVDRAADLAMAEKIVINAKCQKPGVCNALETLLVHREVAADFYPRVCAALREQKVELRGDEQLRAAWPEAKPATEEDWRTEYLDLILAIKTVDSLEEAIEHINLHGSRHSDSIITRDAAAAERFLAAVDSATVFWNASTRFNDGGEFGFGAEIGISTDKLHARGPMALPELTSYKYLLHGTGQIRG